MTTSKRRKSNHLSDEQQDALERALNEHHAEKTPSNVAPALQAMAKKLERSIISNNINHHLYVREESGALSNKNIFPAGEVAPSLRAAKLKLEHSIKTDQVGHLLEGRPEPEALVRTGITTSPVRVAGRIQRVSRQLERSMKQDKVNHLLESRSELHELQARDIIKDTKVAPALQAPQAKLQKNLIRSNLLHALQRRPSVLELIESGVYRMPDEEEFDDDDDDDEYYGISEDDGRYGYENEEDFEEQAYLERLEAAIAASKQYHDYYPAYGDELGAAIATAREQYSDYYPAYEDEDYEDEDEEDEEDFQQEYDGRPVWLSSATAGASYDDGDVAVYADEEEEYQGYEPYAPHELHQKQAYYPHDRSSRVFHLTRVLLKFLAVMYEAGEVSAEEKARLKDLVVDQDATILAVAEVFESENDLADFKDSMIRLANLY